MLIVELEQVGGFFESNETARRKGKSELPFIQSMKKSLRYLMRSFRGPLSFLLVCNAPVSCLQLLSRRSVAASIPSYRWIHLEPPPRSSAQV